MESTISKLNKYKNAVDFDDFIDYLISKKVVDEQNYLKVWNHHKRDRLSTLFNIIDSIDNVPILEGIFHFLKETCPNAEKLSENDDNLRKTSVRGGVPGLPPNYVSRRNLVETLKRELFHLTWEKKLVVHGMMGYGKSCLVNEIIRDPKVSKYFDNYVFWVNLGDGHAWQHMSRLYTAANSVIDTKISQCYEDLELLRDLLTRLFCETKLKNSLLILDNACSDEVLKLFDFKCKTVITTQNKNILRYEDATYIEVKTGFSMNESLELFKKSLQIKGDLPILAEEIHMICQGHPMVIALIGSYLNQNYEMARGSDAEIWLYIKDNILRGQYKLNEYNEHFDISEIVRKCIEKLLTNKELKDKYHDLVIFEQDVNIPLAVLEVLWNKPKFQVLNIMTKLAEKSLVRTSYHSDLQTYMYGVHNLHLNYLKTQTADRIVQMHKKLIDGYDRLTNGNYADLPNDNYTLQFIGHHLLKAEYLEKFSIYFDFKFFEAKIRASGKEDLLGDLDKYEVYITNKDKQLQNKLDQYRGFIKKCGLNLYNYKKTDVLQYALRESNDTVVFQDALKLAKSSQHLYFQLQKSVEEPDYSQNMRIRDDITCACFVDSAHHILIGTSDGKIKLFYEQSPKEISNFVSHSSAIRSLIVGPDRRYFLSISTDGIVCLWKFAPESGRNSRDFSNQIPVQAASPKTKQSYWQDLHTPDKGQILPKAKFQAPENDDCIISAGFCDDFPYTYNIVTGSKRGSVTVWDAREMLPITKTENRGIEVTSVVYQCRGTMDAIVFLCEDIFTYELQQQNKLVYFDKLYAQDTCLSVYCCPDSKVAVSEKSIIIWYNYTPKKVFTWSEENKKNICSTITDDYQYLVIATNQSTVFVWDFSNKKVIREFDNKGLVLSLNTIYDEEKSVHLLLIATDEHTLQLFPLQPCDDNDKIRTKQLPIATLWKRKNVLAVFEATDNCLQVFSGRMQISETARISAPVTSACFSPCGCYLIYGLKNGHVKSFNLKSKKETDINLPDQTTTQHSAAIVTYIACYDPNHSYYSHDHRHCSSPSTSSTDSLDFGDYYPGLIVVVIDSNIVMIYKEGNMLSHFNIDLPSVFCTSNEIIFVDRGCNVFTWNINAELQSWQPNIVEVKVTLASFCPIKSLLAISYVQVADFLDIYQLNHQQNTISLKQRLQMENKIKSICFSSDGSLLAVGLSTGRINVWNIKDSPKSINLTLHSGSVETLFFSPNMEHILVSLGEEIAWWNLKPFSRQQRARGRPHCIDILAEQTSEMDISFWSDRKPIAGEEYLLSCMKLQGEAKYISASRDFNSFLAVDNRGKMYILDIINGQ